MAEPLSNAQQRMWALDRLYPGSTAANEYFVLEIEGPLDVARLEQAWNAVLSRHAALRAVFYDQGNGPVQRVLPEAGQRIELTDLGGQVHSTRSPEVMQMLEARLAQPFDLESGPLIRIGLVRLESDLHFLIGNNHHIVSDGPSVRLIVRELVSRYEDATAPDPDNSYLEFARTQKASFTGPSVAGQLEFWRRYLDGADMVLEMPWSTGQRGEFQQRLIPVRMPKALGKRAGEFARQNGATLFMVLMAAWRALLARYSGQTDFLIGSPATYRNTPDTRDMIGCMVNMIALRADSGGDPGFRELVRKEREGVLESLEYRETPFEMVVEALRPERRALTHPLFQSVFLFEQAGDSTYEAAGVVFRRVTLPVRRAAYWSLELSLERGPDDGISGYLGYLDRQFERPAIVAMARHYLQFLEALIESPEMPFSKVPMLSQDERARALVLADARRAAPDNQPAVTRVIEHQVATRPDSPAVVCGRDSLSYDELNRRANGLASTLRCCSLAGGAVVALCVERSVDFAVGLIGILKSGFAYVPLDPDHPDGRLQTLLGESGASLVVTQDRFRERLLDTGLPLVGIEDCRPPVPGGGRNCDAAPAPEDLAYVIFTSGSTGTPKGVAVEHGSLTSQFLAMLAQPGFANEDVVLSVTSVSFDPSIMDVVVPLMAGGRVVIAERDDILDGARLSQLIERVRPTLMQATPTFWRMLLDSGWQGSREMLALSGGEPLDRDLVTRLTACCRGLWNQYGASETTTGWATSGIVGVNDADLTVGTPVPGVACYVLDEHMEPVAPGLPGRLYVAGAGVARGYVGDADLTADRFLPDPFAARREGRMYATGDLARILRDGRLQLLGRSDGQIKLRGHRIEPVEVETVLRGFDGVDDVAVAVRERNHGDSILVGYLIAQDAPADLVTSLRTHALRQLPEYLVPDIFVLADRLPKTPSGKIDRRALPDALPDSVAGQGHPGTATSDQPAPGLEQQIAQIWGGLLHREVGRHDDFFNLGGHSVLAIRMLRDIERNTGYAPGIADLFANRTVALLAEALEQDRRVRGFRAMAPIRAAGTRAPLFLLHGKPYAMGPHFHPEQPVYALHYFTQANFVPGDSVEEVARQYLREIRLVQPNGPYRLCGFSFGGMVAFEICRQLVAAGEKIAWLGLIDPSVPVDMLGFRGRVKAVIGEARRAGTSILHPGFAFRRAATALWNRVVRAGRLLTGFAFRRLAMPLPDALAPAHNQDLMRSVWRRYTYRPLDIAGVVFVPDTEDEQRSALTRLWMQLMRGNVEFRRVAGVTEHVQFMTEPHVASLVADIEKALNRD